jgi:hypothetical protein
MRRSHSDTGSINQDNEASRDCCLHESRAAALVGRRALDVMYWDAHPFTSEPGTWDYGYWHRVACAGGQSQGIQLTAIAPGCQGWP